MENGSTSQVSTCARLSNGTRGRTDLGRCGRRRRLKKKGISESVGGEKEERGDEPSTMSTRGIVLVGSRGRGRRKPGQFVVLLSLRDHAFKVVYFLLV